MVQQLSKKAGFILAVAGAAVVGGATTAFVAAAIPSSTDGLIHGCYKNNASLTDAKGALRVIDSATTPACSNGETSLNWSQNGGGPKGYAAIIASYDSVNGFTYSLDLQRSKNVIATNPNNLRCLTLTNGVPSNLSATLATGTSSPLYTAFRDQNGWTDKNDLSQFSRECDQDAPGSNIFVGGAPAAFITVY